MIDATITVVGNVATEPESTPTQSGTAFTHFRMASNGTRFDKRSRQWVPEDASFYTVHCWRDPLAKNVKESLKKGDPVFVHGRVKVREWHDDDNTVHRLTEIDARAIGHDLFRGKTRFMKNEQPEAKSEEADAAAQSRKRYAKISDDENVDTTTGEILSSPANGKPPVTAVA